MGQESASSTAKEVEVFDNFEKTELLWLIVLDVTEPGIAKRVTESHT